MPIPIVERSEREMAQKIRRRIKSLDMVADCKEVTLGFTRKKPNIHSHVLLRGGPSFEETHTICYGIDREVRGLVPNARVVIHSTQGMADDGRDIWKIVKRTAEEEPGSRGVQNIHLKKTDGNLGVDFHLQVSTLVTGNEANQLEARTTQNLKAADPRISEVVLHRNTVSDLVSGERWGHGTELRSYLEHVSKRFPDIMWLGPPTIWPMSDGLHLAARVAFKPGFGDAKTTQIRSEFAAAIRRGYPVIALADIIEELRTLGEI